MTDYLEDESMSRPIACQNCRKRRSYCSKTRPRCSRCQDHDVPCIYEGNKKITVNESYFRYLQKKVEAYEQVQKGSAHSTTIIGASDGEEEYNEFSQEHLLAPFTQVHINESSSGYKGIGSYDNFLESVRSLSGLSSHEEDDIQTGFTNFQPSILPCRRSIRQETLQLPPPDVARRLFATQYYYIGTIFAFTDAHEDTNRIPLIYWGPPDPWDKNACVLYAKMLVILAFGQLYSVNQWVDARGPPGLEYLSAAMHYLPEAHEAGCIASVETLALVGYFMQNLDQRAAAFLYTGMALRMAISLGLHQEEAPARHSEVPQDPAPDEAAELVRKERRRRVWWSIYSLDRILCVKSGHPIAILDDDIGVELPSKLPSESDPSTPSAFRCYTQLSCILGQIHTKIYSKPSGSVPKSGKELMLSVQNIMFSLARWNNELPDNLRFDPKKLKVNRESISIFAHYYQCINMTVRPLLFHIVKSRLQAIRDGSLSSKEANWREILSPSTVRMIDICIGGAQDVINMMKIASQQNLIATYGYMDGEHISSAAIVLVMACEAFPYNAATHTAMEDGLAILQTMSERGNAQMGSRSKLLASLSSGSFVNRGRSDGIPDPAWASAAAINHASTVSFRTPFSHESASSCGATGPNQSPTFTFPIVENSYLGKPIYDKSNTDIGQDFQLWEDGFANSATDLSFEFLS